MRVMKRLCTGTTWCLRRDCEFPGHKKTGSWAGFFVALPLTPESQLFSAKMAEFRRLLCRAALFLLMMPLLAIRSITGTAFW